VQYTAAIVKKQNPKTILRCKSVLQRLDGQVKQLDILDIISRVCTAWF
jgi:hypothetical protein